MNFFVDANLAPKLAHALSALSDAEGITVTHLVDKFARNTPDEKWIVDLALEKDWVIFSGDYRITKNPQTRIAWQQSGLTSFFLQKGWTNLKFWDQAWKLVKWWPTIIETARNIQVGTSFLVPITATKLQIIPK